MVEPIRCRTGLWCWGQTACTGSADRTAITMAKWTYGEAHRLDPTAMP
jgi:hypothetical protein